MFLNLCPKLINDSAGCCYLAKQLITLQMFANPSEGEKLHILLVGDPSAGKSILLEEVSHIVPKSRFIGSSKTNAGLLEVFIACNGGIACIDELDKADKKTRMSSLEVMQTQTVSIDQHQYHEQHSARTNILAACNPRRDILTEGIPIQNQVIFSPKELTRYHLIIKFKAIGGSYYSQIAASMVRHDKIHVNNARQNAFRDIIVEARAKIPTVDISEHLASKAGDCVATLKEISELGPLISPRLIEGALSMMKARARMMGRSKANEDDFQYVNKMLNTIYGD